MAEKALLLLFFVSTNGPATVPFDTLAQCRAAQPAIVDNYRDMTGITPMARCVAIKVPETTGAGSDRYGKASEAPLARGKPHGPRE